MTGDPYSDESIDDPYVAWARAQQQQQPLQVAEYGPGLGLILGDLAQPAPPPPPPPPPQRVGPAMGGAPSRADEIAQQPHLSPDEEAQIEIDPSSGGGPTALQADAVTGADPHASVADLTNVSMEAPQQPADPNAVSSYASPDAYLAHQTELAQQQVLPSMQEQQLGDATDKAVGAMTPEQLVQYKTDREGKLIAEQARLEHEAAVRDMEQARQNVAIQQAATAKADEDTKAVLADAQRLSSVTINPDRYRQQRGLGGTMRDMAAGFLSGLGGNADGFMRSFEARINRDIDAQQADIANGWKGVGMRQSEIAAEYGRHGDLYRAQETKRIADYQTAINDIQSQLQLYDPAGSHAIRGRDALDQLHAAQAQALMTFNETQRAHAVEGIKLAIDVRKQQLAESEFAAKQAKVGAAKAVKPEDVLQPPEYFQAVYGKAPPLAMSEKQYEKWAQTGKVVEEYGKAQRENSPEDINRKLAVGEVFDDQGNPVKFRDETFAGALANTKADVATGVALIDEMIRARNEAGGWTSDLVKSEKWRNAQQAAAAWLLKSKNADQLGVLSGSDLELEMKKLTGGADLTGMRDPIPQLINARAHMLNDLHSKIVSQSVLPKGRTVARWEPPNMAQLKETKPLVQGKTAVEQADDARHPLAAVSFRSNDTRMRNAEESADVGPTGLDTDSDKQVVAAIGNAKSGNADAVQRLADTASSSNDAITNAVLARVRAEAPDVYKQVLAKLPPEKRAAAEQLDAVKPLRLAPGFAFDSLSVDDIAAQAHDDPGLQKILFEKARAGKADEKTKAKQVLLKLGGAQ